MQSDVSIRLTRQEYEKLIDCLAEHEDSGPSGSGWKSKELQGLIKSIEAQAFAHELKSDEKN